jgi:hypothetical protein
MDEEAATENFKTNSGSFASVLKDTRFWLEVFFLLLIPYPNRDFALERVGDRTFTMTAINWVDNTGVNTPHTYEYQVTYMKSDIMTVASFIRIYFVMEAVFILLPLGSLFSKKTCKNSGFNADFTFQLKAIYKERPAQFFIGIASISVLMFAFIIRIWERPYY